MSDINLIPDDLMRKEKKIKQICMLILPFLFLALIIFAGINYYKNLNDTFAGLRKQQEVLEEKVLEVKKFENEINKIEYELRALTAIERTHLGKKLLAVKGLIPGGITMDYLEINNEELIIKGYCMDFAMAGLMVGKLMQLDFIYNADLKSFERDSSKEGSYYFTVLCKLEQGK